MDRRLRLGVIGAGSFAVASHLPNLAKRKEVRFVAVARKGAALLYKIMSDFGFEVASEDYHDVINAGIDICVVASPSAYHYEHAKSALEAGAHVLVEKPMTIEPAQAWDLVETAQRADLHLVCSFGWNFLPMLQAAKRLMEAQGVGEVEHLVVHMSSATRELLSNRGAYPGAAEEFLPEHRTWTDTSVSGGGYAQAQLSHAMALALWMTGLRGQEAFAYMSTIFDSPVEHYDAVSMRFSNGAIGTMAGGSGHLGFDANKPELAMRVIGSEGQFACDVQRELVWLYRADGEEVRLPAEPGDGLYNCDGPPNALVDLALGRDVRNWAPGELGARTVEILDAAYRSAASGKPESVAEKPKPERSAARSIVEPAGSSRLAHD